MPTPEKLKLKALQEETPVFISRGLHFHLFTVTLGRDLKIN